MCSKPVGEREEIPIQFTGGKSARRSSMDVSVFKKTGLNKWEKQELTDLDSKMIRDAFENIRAVGERSGSKAWGAFKKEGAVLKITKKQIKDGKKDLLSDKTVDGKTRKEVRSCLESSFRVIENVFGKETQIEINVLPPAQLFKKRFDEDKQVYKQNYELFFKFDNEAKQTFLANGISEEGFLRVKKNFRDMLTAWHKLQSVPEETQPHLEQKNYREALVYFTSNFNETYSVFCNAMREVYLDQLMLKSHLGENHDFQVQTHLPAFYRDMARELHDYVEDRLQRQEMPDVSKVMQEIENTEGHFTKFTSFVVTTQRQIKNLINQEDQFQQQVTESRQNFENHEFIASLEAKGWHQSEIADHRQALANVQDVSNHMIAQLKSVEALLQDGFIQEGIEQYANFKESFKDYADQLEKLNIPQNLARGRFFTEELPQLFQIDLNHLNHHLDFLESLEQRVKDLGLPRASIDPSKWEKASKSIKATQSTFRDTLKPSLLEQHLNDNYEKTKILEGQIRQFVDAYSSHRELLEELMRREGASTLEASFMFNYYSDLLNTVFVQFNTRMQTVVDSANKQNYEEAMEQYTQLIEDFQEIFETRGVYAALASEGLLADPVKNALNNFQLRLGFKSGEIRHALSLQRVVTNRQMVFNDAIKYAKNIELPLPENIVQVQEKFENCIQMQLNKIVDFESLTKETTSFFEMPQSFSNEKSQAWKAVLRQNKWSESEMKSFKMIATEYASLVRPLRRGKQAIKTEKDPIKQRDLQAQIKQLADELMPRINNLHKKFNAKGGMERLRSLESMSRDFNAQLPENEKETKFEQEATHFVNRMKERAVFLNELYEDLGIFSKFQNGEIGKLLFERLDSNDPAFISVFSTSGWSRADVRALCSWYDTYIEAALPLSQVKRALDNDPENPELQKSFKAVAKKQLPAMKKLSREFGQKFKDFNRVKKLESAIQGYKNFCANEVERLRTQLKEDMPANQREIDNALLNKYQTSEKQLSQVSFSVVSEMNQLAVDASKMLERPLSWDEKYLDVLFDAKSPLQRIRINKKEPIWDSFLQKSNVSKRDIQDVKKLYSQFQSELLQLAKLERKFGQNPKDIKNNEKFLEEIRQKRGRIVELQINLIKVRDKIDKLQQAVLEFNLHLINNYNSMKQEMESSQLISGAPSQVFQQAAARTRASEFGNLSDMEIEDLIHLTSQINLVEAFDNKNQLWESTYKRFRDFL